MTSNTTYAILIVCALLLLGCSGDGSSDFKSRVLEISPAGSIGFNSTAAEILVVEAQDGNIDIFEEFRKETSDKEYARQLQFLLIVSESEQYLDYVEGNSSKLPRKDLDMIKSWILLYEDDNESGYADYVSKLRITLPVSAENYGDEN